MARSTSFNNKWAASGDKTAFAAMVERVQIGWEGGVDKDAPRAPQQNAWQFRADEALQDLERQGVMSWIPDAVYGIGAPTYGSDGNFYESIQANNSGNNPTSSTGFWRQVGTSFFSSVPVGTVISVAHNDAPDAGWLKCNGAPVSRTAYARLFAKIGTSYGNPSASNFSLPDFRGEFLRGLDDGRGVNAGRKLGVIEYDQVGPHSHGFQLRRDKATFRPGDNENAVYGDENRNGIDTLSTLLTTTNETRPRNMAVVYWIKF